MLGRERMARQYESGQLVFHQGTPSLAVLSVHSGLVQLTRDNWRGSRIVVGLRGPGELVGVRSVLARVPYQVSVETLEPSTLCSVPREIFLAVVRDCPELAMRLLEHLAKDYLLTEEQLVARSSLSVRARTARLLIGAANGAQDGPRKVRSHEIVMAREEMALLIGTTRETLSRTLSQLAKRGSVALEDGKVRVLDHAGLERLAD